MRGRIKEKAKTWRLSKQALDALAEIRRITGSNETACVERALIDLADRLAESEQRRKGMQDKQQ